MGKNKGKTKSKDLSKKELKRREAELELALKAKKAAKKKAKKSKAEPVKKAKRPEVPVMTKAERKALLKSTPAGERPVDLHDEVGAPETHEPVSAEAVKAAKKEAKAAKATGSDEAVTAAETIIDGAETDADVSPQAVIEAADKVLAQPDVGKETAAHARKMRNKALEQLNPDELKKRVHDKAAARKALADSAHLVPRDDAEAVARYNAAIADLGGGTLLTTTDELAARQASVAEDAPMPSLEPKKAKGKKVKAGSKGTEPDEATTPEQVVEAVETERGTVYAVGDMTSEDPALAARIDEGIDADPATGEVVDDGKPLLVNPFAKPSEAPKTDFEQNGNGQYKIKRLSDGKVVGYTRATTYISVLESTAMLEKWKMRLLLEGITIDATTPGDEQHAFVAGVADLMHRHDVTIAKARKADRKGKLKTGELGRIVDGAHKEYRDALNALAEDALDVAGVHDKATKGTDLHALCEIYDLHGIDAVGDLLTEGKITPADLADVEAYARAMERAGIRVLKEHVEQVVVNEPLKVAGRLDRVVLAKFPGSTRAVRCVGDIKTGSIEFSPGKIGQQLEMYASSEGYDLNTHERSDLKLSRTKAVLIHLPAGTATCHIYPVDLGVGRVGNKLAGEVREFRNTGKRAIDTSVDLAAIETTEASAEQ